MRTGIVTATLLVGLLIAAPPASAAVSSVDSATDQYVEYIPEVVGREDGKNSRGADKGSRPGSVPEKQLQRLEQRGSAGAAAAALAESTAPPAYPGTGHREQGWQWLKSRQQTEPTTAHHRRSRLRPPSWTKAPRHQGYRRSFRMSAEQAWASCFQCSCCSALSVWSGCESPEAAASAGTGD